MSVSGPCFACPNAMIRRLTGFELLPVLCIVASGCNTPSFGATAEPLGILPQAAIVQGRDGGQSGLVFGHSVWTFGDTVLNAPDAEGVTWHQNSWSYTDDRVAGDGISGFTAPLPP